MEEELELFLEDMEDQLSIMESTLLDICELPLDQIDQSAVDKLFRAMHTMKGNAGIFDFDIIVSFAHEAETLLDEIRTHKITLNDDLLELFLNIKDHSKMLIDIYAKGDKLQSERLDLHNELLTKIRSYLNDPLEDDFSNNEILKDQNDIHQSVNYTINVKLKEDFFKSGMDILSIIKYLDALGEIKNVELSDDDVPPFDKLDVLNAYLGFKIVYETDEPQSEIIDAFEFVQEDIELNIEKTKSSKEKENKHVTESLCTVETAEKTIKNEQSSKEKPLKDSLKSNFSLKVESLKVDKLINQISEMVIANAKIIRLAQNSQNTELNEAVETMSEMLEEVRNSVMDIRMVQVGNSFSKLRRIVSDAAKKLNKDIDFQILGGDTELDKSVVEKISDPLVHMLRNSVDHGIESKQERLKLNKDPKGKITLKAYPDAGTIVIQVIDDGAGIDKETILKKAIEKKLISQDELLNDNQIYNLLFAPGFSTAQKLSDLSGRGVGMDVVKRNIEDLRGSIEIESRVSKGTTVTVRLPLTLAIIDGFLVQSGSSKYIIPIDNIQECVELTSDKKNELEKNGYITLRSQVLSVLDISEHFNEKKSTLEKTRENIVVVRFGKSKVGLKVDELYGEYQTVIKPLGEFFKNIQGISGGTILGDGSVALIFDIQKLIEYKIMQG